MTSDALSDAFDAGLLTPDEVAKLLRTTRRAIYAMTERAQLQGVVRVGRRLLFRRDKLLAGLGLIAKERRS